MPATQSNVASKQEILEAQIAEASKGNLDKIAKENADQNEKLVGLARDGVVQMNDVRERASEITKQAMQNAVDTASHQVQEVADRFAKTLGFSGEDGERLAHQSKENMEVVTRTSTVLGHALHDASRRLFDFNQKQFQRNLRGLTKLSRAKSIQEFAAIQSDLLRESLQHMLQDSKAITDASVRAVDDASKVFSSVAPAR